MPFLLLWKIPWWTVTWKRKDSFILQFQVTGPSVWGVQDRIPCRESRHTHNPEKSEKTCNLDACSHQKLSCLPRFRTPALGMAPCAGDQQWRQSPTDVLRGQPHLDNSQPRLSSQVILGNGKLTQPQPVSQYKVFQIQASWLSKCVAFSQKTGQGSKIQDCEPFRSSDCQHPMYTKEITSWSVVEEKVSRVCPHSF